MIHDLNKRTLLKRGNVLFFVFVGISFVNFVIASWRINFGLKSTPHTPLLNFYENSSLEHLLRILMTNTKNHGMEGLTYTQQQITSQSLHLSNLEQGILNTYIFALRAKFEKNISKKLSALQQCLKSFEDLWAKYPNSGLLKTYYSHLIQNLPSFFVKKIYEKKP